MCTCSLFVFIATEYSIVGDVWVRFSYEYTQEWHGCVIKYVTVQLCK